MLKLSFCFSFFVITLVTANYDFHDPDFNEMLFQDITTEIKDLTLRYRRSATDNTACECQEDQPKEEKYDVHCCRGQKPKKSEGLKKAREAKKKCFAEIRGDSDPDADVGFSYDPLTCEGIQAMREKTVCAAECIVKKLDLLDDSGAFKRDALLNHTLSTLVGEGRWNAKMMETYVDGCLNELKTVGNEKSKNVKPSCNPLPLEYHHCIWKKLVEGCPVESQMDTKKCQKIRERLTKGDTSHAQKFYKKLFKN
ncbi:uncharacterized protein LOC129953516 [Eupeodes corollae]|uniref:uncharacterized protein LOC129953516 n=1 Tax=Eupeodes corollae TaxID=290404 RepID=UPI0024928CAA|nr:uncharacterized protein LOC129953516 [Eupeodes corollae]